MKRKIFDAPHIQFRDSVKKHIEKKILPHYSTWEEEGMVSKDAWRQAGAENWLCPEADPKFGGAGADFIYTVILTEELYYYGVAGFFVPLHNGIVFPYINRLADEAQKQRWVPGCVSGEKILALAMTEPEVGSDIAKLRTEARKDGDYYVLNGSKTFISNGQLADLFVVAVRTDHEIKPAHRGISLIVVESDSPGFVRGRNLKKIGFHAQDTSEIFFDKCRVPACNLLGQEGLGFKYMMENLQQERLVLAIGATAAAQGCLDLTLNYVRTRKAFDQELSKFQNTRFVLAEAATKTQLSQSFIDQLIQAHMAGDKLVKEVSMAKYWSTENQFEVAHQCLQLFGGYGYMREYPVSRFFIDARVQSIYGGTNEIMKELIARELLVTGH